MSQLGSPKAIDGKYACRRWRLVTMMRANRSRSRAMSRSSVRAARIAASTTDLGSSSLTGIRSCSSANGMIASLPIGFFRRHLREVGHNR